VSGGKTGEISISEFDLGRCQGNLKVLRSDWSAMPGLSDSCISDSKGRSPEAIVLCTGAAQQVSSAMDGLLKASVAFFESAGISFKEADEAAAGQIDKLST